MRLNQILATSLTLFLLSCSVTQNISQLSTEVNPATLPAVDSLSILIEAINLSEDMSTFSSKNDELLILIYDFEDTLELSPALLSKQIHLGQVTRSKKFRFAVDRKSSKSRLLLILIEQDSETSMEQIDPIFRIQHQQIISAFNDRDYLTIEKYLGDEDLLGVKIIPNIKKGSHHQFKLEGIYKLDRYEYSVKIEK